MERETFASYILNETDWAKKLEIMYYLKKKTGIFYDNTVVFKTLITKQFLDYLKEKNPDNNLDENLIITARLLCDCLKKENSTDLEDIRSYAKKGAEYLSKLGFDERFCRICEGVNRYTISQNREPESDIIELTDQFGGMLLDRPERIGFKADEALVLLQFRNLKDKDNKFMSQFIKFVNYLEKIDNLIKENIKGGLTSQADIYNRMNIEEVRYGINSAPFVYSKINEAIEEYKNRPINEKERQIKVVDENTLNDIKEAMHGRETMGIVSKNEDNPYIEEESDLA